MSSKTSSSPLQAPRQVGARLTSACWNRAAASVRATAFWAAILLPLAYIPAAYGAIGFAQAWSSIALIAFHIACVVTGHNHNSVTSQL
ncbi:hypothetical protein DJ73_11585 [Halorubrum sp. Ea1]|nr:hypothetical protein DJ73_11585 [Halorubrum sp. Ea1]